MNLTLELHLDKDSYRQDEAIMATLTLRNTGAEELFVRKRMTLAMEFMPDIDRDLIFHITSPSGRREEMQVIPHIRLPKLEHFVTLTSNESVTSTRDLQQTYRFTEGGVYTIRAVYTNVLDAPDGREAWKGTLESNVVTFTIEP